VVDLEEAPRRIGAIIFGMEWCSDERYRDALTVEKEFPKKKLDIQVNEHMDCVTRSLKGRAQGQILVKSSCWIRVSHDGDFFDKFCLRGYKPCSLVKVN
jgi:hypothetical protein